MKVHRCENGFTIGVGRKRFRFRFGKESAGPRTEGRERRSSTEHGHGKSWRLAPGVRMNVFEEGVGLSLGVNHTRIRVGVGSSGRAFASGDVPRTVSSSRVVHRPTGPGALSLTPELGDGGRGLPGGGANVLAILCLILGVALTPLVVSHSLKYGLIFLALSTVPLLLASRRTALATMDAPIVNGGPPTGVEVMVAARAAPTPTRSGSLLPTSARLNGGESSPTMRLVLAQAHMDSGAPKRAARILTELLAESFDEDTAMLLATAHYQAQHFDQAILSAQRIEESSRWWLQSIGLMGSAFAEKGKHELAIKTLEKAPIRARLIHDDLREIHFQLAESYTATGNHRKAAHHFRRAEGAKAPREVAVALVSRG